MSEPEIYFYTNGSVEKLAQAPTLFDKKYERYSDKSGTVERVEVTSNEKGMERKQVFTHPISGYIAEVNLDNDDSGVRQIFHPMRDKKTDPLLVDLVMQSDAEVALRKHGGNRRILLIDRLKR